MGKRRRQQKRQQPAAAPQQGLDVTHAAEASEGDYGLDKEENKGDSPHGQAAGGATTSDGDDDAADLEESPAGAAASEQHEGNYGILAGDYGTESSGDGGSGDAGSSGDADDEDDAADGGRKRRRTAAAGFLEGGKGGSFAKAFAKIMGKPVPVQAAAGAAAAAGGAKGRGAQPADVVLAGSASVQKRATEEMQGHTASREAKRQRLAMRQRGHAKVPRKGEDPTHDAREKALQRLATRGVVLLFNAVNKAQRQKEEALLAGKKRARVDKASFLEELRAGAAAAAMDGGAGSIGGLGVGRSGQRGQREQELDEQLLRQRQVGGAGSAEVEEGGEQGGGAAGWDVLGEGFPGLTGGSKMKDWNKQAAGESSDEGGDRREQPQLAGSDSGGDDGW